MFISYAENVVKTMCFMVSYLGFNCILIKLRITNWDALGFLQKRLIILKQERNVEFGGQIKPLPYIILWLSNVKVYKHYNKDNVRFL